MHHITDIKSVSKDIAAGLKVLKERIAAAQVPSSNWTGPFNLATWNIREFGESRAPRSPSTIAEVLGQFDLHPGLVELRDDLRDLRRVLDVLGPYWRAVYSDAVLDPAATASAWPYLYDKRQIAFSSMASTAFAHQPPGTGWVPDFNWWRPPTWPSFKSGSFDFVIVSTHIRWGDGK